MGFKYRRPSVKVGGVTILKNKKGFSVSSKSITGGRKTYNSATGKTTKTYKTGMPGLSYSISSGSNSNRGTKLGNRKVNATSTELSNHTKKDGWFKNNWSVLGTVFSILGIFAGYSAYLIPLLICLYFWYKKNKSNKHENTTTSEALDNSIFGRNDGDKNSDNFTNQEAKDISFSNYGDKNSDNFTNLTGNKVFSNNTPISKSSFPFLDNDGRYLKYSYPDVEVKGTEYLDINYDSIKLDELVLFEEEPENLYDQNAIKIMYNDSKIGYVPKNNLQSMIKDFKNVKTRDVRGFISKIDKNNKSLNIALGFYEIPTNSVKVMDAKLVGTKKITEFDDRQSNLGFVNVGEEVELDYDFDKEKYIVSSDGFEIGELSKSQSEKLQVFEDEGYEIKAGILELGEDDNLDITCKIRIILY